MKALVLLSGGLDSATCLAKSVEKWGSENNTALSVFYGQKHQRERESALAVARYYNVPLFSLDLSEIFKFSDCPLLETSAEDIPHESYSDQLKKRNGAPVLTYVPFRNGLFLSSAASFALSQNCEIIYYGAHADDAAGNAYPDCSSDFNDAMNQAIWEGSGHRVKIEAPFVNCTKAEVVRQGLELKVPYELTWSCYEGGEKPCGVCGTCRDRADAFAENHVVDPLLK